jgi:16S rRNA C967 or C1407 C5-methylase (RsmB/RsmF family)/NOL1/NOP2/fmu family ribosome biogenesis protein
MKQLPGTFLDSINSVAGFDINSFTASHTTPPPVSVRMHAVKYNKAFNNNEHVPWCGLGRYLESRPVFTLDPLFHAGTYYVQEASSMFLDYMVRSILPERKGLRVLDLCAAPGGKSTLLASLLDDTSLLVSNEVIRTRAGILEENITRWGYMNTWVVSNDAKDLGRLKGYFDLIVVDAPCSGSGLFRKDERAIDEWSLANVQLCSERQKRIIADVWPALKEGGKLVYATCSYSAEEDEQVMDWISETFDAKGIDLQVPQEWGIVKTTSAHGSIDGYRFFPGKVRGEGFFISAVTKISAQENIKTAKFKTLQNKVAYTQSGFLLNNSDYICMAVGKDQFNAIRSEHEADVIALQQQHIFFRKCGIVLGAPAAKEWLPAHDVALSIHVANDIPSIEVNKEQALRFLKKEELQIPVPAKGWYLVKYMDAGLGWLKSVGNRFNNYLPKNQRIRMDINEVNE